MIYYEFKPIKAIYAMRGQYGLQPINAVYYGSRKIWEPGQLPLDKVIINVYSYSSEIGKVDVGYFEGEYDPAYRVPIGEGNVEIQITPGTYFALNALPFAYPAARPQVNMYVEKNEEPGVLYENTNFIELDTSSPAVYDIRVSLAQPT